jgi:hypothetical protein
MAYLKKLLKFLAKHKQVNLRSLERVMMHLTLSLAMNDNMVTERFDPILLGLVVLKVTNQVLFRQVKSGEASYVSIDTALGFAQIPVEYEEDEHINGEEKQTFAVAVQAKKAWRCCMDGTATPREVYEVFDMVRGDVKSAIETAAHDIDILVNMHKEDFFIKNNQENESDYQSEKY